jgi:dGTP triphosphohydrolase
LSRKDVKNQSQIKPFKNPDQYRQYYDENTSEWACKYTVGCRVGKTPSDHLDRLGYRSEFQRDRDDIIYSTSFRRLAYKRQMYFSTGLSSFYTRLTHTLIVAQIARSLAKGLRLDENLTEAIALGHDLGHAPYGHPGEDGINDFLNEKLFPKVYKETGENIDNSTIETRYQQQFDIKQPELFDKIRFTLEDLQKEFYSRPQQDTKIFSHHEQAFRIVEYLERNRNGMRLTRYAIYGILRASGSERDDTGFELPLHGINTNFASFEGQVVRLADDIAWANHDLTEDEASTGRDPQQMLTDFIQVHGEEKLGVAVREMSDFLRLDRGERYGRFITDIIETNKDKLSPRGFLPTNGSSEGYHIGLSKKMTGILSGLKKLVILSIHAGSEAIANAKESRSKVKRICDLLLKPEEFRIQIHKSLYSPYKYDELSLVKKLRVIVDYVTYLSDQQADDLYEKKLSTSSTPEVEKGPLYP